MKRRLFSVLIANYNNGKYLMDAVESVRQQTYENWEIILVDDASTDNSSAIYDELQKDPRIHIYKNDINRGCGYTKRRCAELANGELCGFLDPDDALVNNALELMVKVHSEYLHVSLVGSCYWVCDENMNKLWQSQQRKIEKGQSWLTGINHPPIHFSSYKKLFYHLTDGIDGDIKRAVDLDLYLKLEEVGNLLFLPDVTYFYRQHTNQISTKGDIISLYWQCYVITTACKRRGLDASVVVNNLVMNNIDWYYYSAKGLPVPGSKISFVERIIVKCRKLWMEILK